MTSPLLKKAKQVSRNKKLHSVNILDSGEDALLARLHLIRRAAKSIDIQTFIWKKDAVGLKILEELLQAAKRGVRVRLLVDYWIMTKEHDVARMLSVEHKNFETRFYNPPTKKMEGGTWDVLGSALFNFRGVNQRMHNKIFLIDDKLTIIGGRNYDSTYYDRGDTRNFVDLDVMVSGPVISDVKKSFQQFWRSALSKKISYFKDLETIHINISLDYINEYWKPAYTPLFSLINKRLNDDKVIKRKFVDGAYKCRDISFIYDPPGKNKTGGLRGGGVASKRLARFLYRARRRILIQSPYLVLSREAVDFIKQLEELRPKVEIIVSTNSLAATDNLYAYAFLFKEKKSYVKDLRFRIFEMKPVPKDIKKFMNRAMLKFGKRKGSKHSEFTKENKIINKGKHLCIHSKVFIVDNNKLWVGTFNADLRSENINTEMALIINDKTICSHVQKKIMRIIDPSNSWTVGPKDYVPVLTEINDELTTLSQNIPLIDLWPFRNVTCFELKKGKKEVPFYDKRFYKNYRPVGPFPKVKGALSEREIKVRLIQMFGQVVKPII